MMAVSFGKEEEPKNVMASIERMDSM